MKKYVSGLLVALLLVAAGCYKDKGNYDLHAINGIIFKTSSPDTIRVKLFDRLTVKMDIEQTNGQSQSNLEFSWRLFAYPDGGATIRLGNRKDVDTLVTFTPAVYKMVLDVKDKSTGVTTFREFIVDISTSLSEGWVLLEDVNGARDLAMVTPMEEVLRNIYATANGESLPAGCRYIRVQNVVNSSQEIYVYGGTDGVTLSYFNFQRLMFYKDWFFGVPNVLSAEAVYYNKYGVAAFLVNNGKVHTLGLFDQGPKKFGAPVEGDYTISPQPLPMLNNDLTMFYDTKNQRFLKHELGKINALASPAGSAFELNNVGKVLVYAGRSIGEFHNCVMKDNGAPNFHVYRINTASDIIAAEKHAVLDAPGIDRAKLFASSEIYLQVFYAVDNRIYLLDIPAGKARLAYEFPAGELVTSIRMKQAQSIFVSYPDNNRLMAVATYDGAEGRFYKFPISTTGDFTGATYSARYEGFGKILDIDYKNRK